MQAVGTVGDPAVLAAVAAGADVLLLSVHVGLFGFRDSLAAPCAGLSLVAEFTATGLLLAGAALIAAARPASPHRASRPAGPR